MQTVSFKMDEALARDIDRVMKERRYATKTEFIREAVRKQLEILRKEEALMRLASLQGSVRKTTDTQREAAREAAGREVLRRFGIE